MSGPQNPYGKLECKKYFINAIIKNLKQVAILLKNIFPLNLSLISPVSYLYCNKTFTVIVFFSNLKFKTWLYILFLSKSILILFVCSCAFCQNQPLVWLQSYTNLQKIYLYIKSFKRGGNSAPFILSTHTTSKSVKTFSYKRKYNIIVLVYDKIWVPTSISHFWLTSEWY